MIRPTKWILRNEGEEPGRDGQRIEEGGNTAPSQSFRDSVEGRRRFKNKAAHDRTKESRRLEQM